MGKKKRNLSQKKQVAFKIRKNFSLGSLEAESDSIMLSNCFVENEDFKQLIDCRSNKSVILGRVGAGKSALIQTIESKKTNCIRIEPQALSFSYIENSNIINYLESIGLKIDNFYKLLWRHVLTVELIKKKYAIVDEPSLKIFFSQFTSLFSKDKRKQKAIEYLKEWDGEFWQDTEVRVREITGKIEESLKTSLGSNYQAIALKGESSKQISEEVKAEIIYHASKVVNEIQIRKLSDIIKLLADDLFEDPMNKYYIVIDQLDDDWVDSSIRFKLIKALIEEIKSFRKIRSLKIIVALRKDLLDKVFDATRSSGFQQEKYDNFLLDLKWTESELREIVNRRIAKACELGAHKQKITLGKIMPEMKGKVTPFQYIIDRTLLRPRDALQYMNELLKAAHEKEKITWKTIRATETIYSKLRLNSLFEEWELVFSSLKATVSLLEGITESFTKTSITEDRLLNVFSKYTSKQNGDIVNNKVLEYLNKPDKNISENDLIYLMLSVLYRVGAIGVKLRKNESFSFSHKHQSEVTTHEIEQAEHFRVNKIYCSALNVKNLA